MCSETVQVNDAQMRREELASRSPRFVCSDNTRRLVVEAHPTAAVKSNSSRLAAPDPQLSKNVGRFETWLQASVKPMTESGVDGGTAARVHDDDESADEKGGTARRLSHSLSDSDLRKSVRPTMLLHTNCISLLLHVSSDTIIVGCIRRFCYLLTAMAMTVGLLIVHRVSKKNIHSYYWL